MLKTKRTGRLAAAMLAAVTAGSVLTAVPATAADAGYDILVLGDSISARFGMEASEYCFQDYVKDAAGATSLTDCAVSGWTTSDLLTFVKDDANQDKIANAELIVISIGGNDLLHAALEFVKENAGTDLDSITTFAKELAAKGKEEAQNYMFKLTGVLRPARNTALDNLKLINTALRKCNSSAKIVFQTVYNPFERAYAVFEGKDYSSEYVTLSDYIKGQLSSINKGIAKLDNVLIADVYTSFRNNAWIYTKNLENDIHPNALGHAVIAGTVLDAIGMENKTAKAFSDILHAEKKEQPFFITSDVRDLLNRHAGVKVTHKAGDLDMNNSIEAKDATISLVYFSETVVQELEPDELKYKLNAEQKELADLNGDGKINASDTVYILKYFNAETLLGEEGVVMDDFRPCIKG